jgi:hypothetical protein
MVIFKPDVAVVHERGEEGETRPAVASEPAVENQHVERGEEKNGDEEPSEPS